MGATAVEAWGPFMLAWTGCCCCVRKDMDMGKVRGGSGRGVYSGGGSWGSWREVIGGWVVVVAITNTGFWGGGI